MSNSTSHNKIAFKVRVYDELYEKIVLEAGQMHLTIGEYARRVFEDRHQLVTLPPRAKPIALNAAARDESVPSGITWVCECYQANIDDWCSSCAKPRPEN